MESSQELEQTNTNLQSSNQAPRGKEPLHRGSVREYPNGSHFHRPDYRVSALNKAAQAIFGLFRFGKRP
jgi:hypothetical protein